MLAVVLRAADRLGGLVGGLTGVSGPLLPLPMKVTGVVSVLATRSETSDAPLGEPRPVVRVGRCPARVVPIVLRPMPHPNPPQNELEYPLKPANPANGLNPPNENPPYGDVGADATLLKLLDAAA